MDIFRNLKIGSKIIVGYIIVLALVAVIGAVAILRFNQIDATVVNLADNLAAEQHLSDEIISQIWKARFFANRYIGQQNSDDLGRFNDEIARFDELLGAADERFTAAERERLLNDIKIGIQVFEEDFYEVADLIDERNTISQGTLDVQGSLADLKLTELRESIFETGDAVALYHVGNAQSIYLYIRLNTFRYLATGDKQWVSERRYEEIQKTFDLLQQHLEDPDQLKLVDEAETAIEAYIQGLTWIQTDYALQNQIVTENLNVIGQEVEEAGAEISTDVTADFQEAHENTRVSVDQTQAALLITIGMAIIVGLGFSVAISHSITNPVTSLTRAVRLISEGDLTQKAPVTTNDEIGELGIAFNTMAERISTLVDTLEQRVAERTVQLSEANKQLEQSLVEQQRVEEERARLQQQVIEAQKQTIQELSAPIIPVTEQIIVMPLIGIIDTLRARDITRSLLTGISAYRAKVVILDITGVPVVDSGIAAHLDKAIQAARLKGARVIVTGISDAVAEAIVDLGIDWRGIETRRDLQTGLLVALNSMGIELTKKSYI